MAILTLALVMFITTYNLQISNLLLAVKLVIFQKNQKDHVNQPAAIEQRR